jgi:hypothetical protein
MCVQFSATFKKLADSLSPHYFATSTEQPISRTNNLEHYTLSTEQYVSCKRLTLQRYISGVHQFSVRKLIIDTIMLNAFPTFYMLHARLTNI